ncbi:MAG: helicase associated domain-containing protein [Bacteroidota bacterium]
MEEDDNDILLDDFIGFEKLSDEAINICKSNGLDSLFEIIEFFDMNDSFMGLENCCDTINDELIAVCEKYKSKNVVPFEYNAELELIHSLTDMQIETLNEFLNYKLFTLKSYNKKLYAFLLQISDADFSVEFLLKMFSYDFNLLVRDVVRKSRIRGYYRFKNSLENFIYSISSYNESELFKTKALLCAKIGFNNIILKSFKEKEFAFDESGKIKLFATLKKLLDFNNLPISNFYYKLFPLKYTYNDMDFQTFEAIGNNLDFKSERVRLPLKKLKNKLDKYLENISYLNSKVIVEYKEGKSDSLIVLNDAQVRKINENENVDFNITFYELIYDLLYGEKFKVLPNNKVKIIQRKNVLVKRSGNIFRIKNEIYNKFNFIKFINKFRKLMYDKYTPIFNLREYIRNEVVDCEDFYYNEIFEVCKSILLVDLNIKTSNEGCIFFEKETEVETYTAIYELMKKTSEPMKIQEIQGVLNTSNPLKKFTEEKIHFYLIKYKKIFVLLGRSNIWGLKEWETEKENFKGGCIRDIVVEFLSNNENPVLNSELVEYVMKYRPDTNHRSILSSLSTDTHKKFIFFKNNFIGLSGKEYPAKFAIPLKKPIKWDQRIIELKKFLEVNNRLPSTYSVNPEEKNLSIYLLKQKYEYQKGKLSKERFNFLRSINYPLEERIYKKKLK